MKNYEAFLAIREKISEDERRIPTLQNELLNKQRAQVQLDEEARRAWALDEPNAGKLKATAEENEKAVVRLEEELKKLKTRVALMGKDSISMEEKAIRDLQVHYRALAEPLVKELAKRLRAAAEIEAEIQRLDYEAKLKGLTITVYPRVIMPIIFRFLLPDQGRFNNGPLGRFFGSLREDNFEVGEDPK